MAKKTKKVGSAGRFQARYGVRSRTRVRDVEQQQRAKYPCKHCGQKTVTRIGTSIWKCKKCGVTYAGGAYIPRTEQGVNVEKMMRGGVESPVE